MNETRNHRRTVRQSSALPLVRSAARSIRVFRIPFWLVLGTICLVAAGCKTPVVETSETQIELEFNPADPVVGTSNVVVELADAKGQPVEGSEVRVEGNMNHAGMKPSFAEMKEIEPGKYSGDLEFTMGGDWFLLITVKNADGSSVERKIDVPGVQVE